MNAFRRRVSLFALLAALLIATIACGESVDVTSSPERTRPPTDVPTNTPVPTEPQESEQEESDYALTLLDIMERYAVHTTNMAMLFSEAGEDPLLILDAGWIEDFATEDANLRILNDEVRNLNPPSRFEAVHNDLLKAANDIDTALDYLERGIDEIDPDALNTGADYLLRAGDHIDDATSKIENIE